MMHRKEVIIGALLFAVCVRVMLGVNPHSGFSKKPMYGDFEAQRHWKEITINLPTDQWYVNGTDNDLMYWGLDYPPLTAYHHFLVGKVFEKVHPPSVSLHESRGNEDKQTLLLMRSSALISDCILFILPVLLLHNIFHFERLTLSLLFAVDLLVIDHVHFQYNHISLGLMLLALITFKVKKPFFSVLCFLLSVSYKQIALYYSLTFVVAVIRDFAFGSLGSFMACAAGVIVVAATVFLPFHSTIFDVFARIFPFYRGAFEDKVASFWCIITPVFDIRQFKKGPILATALTVVCSLIPITLLFKRHQRHHRFQQLTKALFLQALTFFFFSYQVHEKSILYPSLMVHFILYNASDAEKYKLLPYWFLWSLFSMSPLLLTKDIVYGAFFGLYILSIFMHIILQSKVNTAALCTSVAVHLVCIVLMIFGHKPITLPWIYDYLISGLSFAYFGLVYIEITYHDLLSSREQCVIKK
ncbi:hypothetical protein PCE1_003467 [Barthelona sp. PCE]